MIVACGKCGQQYNDEFKWTICPHNVLEAGPTTPRYNCGNSGYCAGHDLFNCPGPATKKCVRCGEAMSGHEDENGTHCRWCVTCSPASDDDVAASGLIYPTSSWPSEY